MKYQSERGKVFDTPQGAIEFDRGIPNILRTRYHDLREMIHTGQFRGFKVGIQNIQDTKDFIKEFEQKLERAKKSDPELKFILTWRI